MGSIRVINKLKLKAGTSQFLLAVILLQCLISVNAEVSQANLTAKPAFSTSAPYPLYVDLSHPLNNQTLHWPTNEGFSYYPRETNQSLDNGVSQFISSDSFHTATHTGTHLDAPQHFNKVGWTVDMIPLDRLADVPISIVNVSAKVAQDRSYSFTKDDMRNVLPNSLVLVYTGVSQDYDAGVASYFGTNSTNMTQMRIPGFGDEAANFLVKEMKVVGVGLDSASVDSSTRHLSNDTGDMIAHRIFGQNNVYMIENIHKNLKILFDQPKGKGVTVTINPLSIVGGSGTPIRLIARVGQPKDIPHSGSLNLSVSFYSTAALVITSLLVSSYLWNFSL